jgi:hypothetical protein
MSVPPEVYEGMGRHVRLLFAAREVMRLSR